ncbi:hypothetical protein [Alkalicoccobacillus murimartini]|uniref:Uncharacterized protein n=1 Tax=Alkalicoccobacillus murimartini TaxID=171685 RepID=A0ABT9YEW8_9BACI|nr:hypothetical protein [Alkalicoccobacillus murimartini]MDQ0206375.1 hypothetical protein [Alkalicoccobacillus murimartini]
MPIQVYDNALLGQAKDSKWIYYLIEDLSKQGILPTVPTLCHLTKSSRKDVFGELDSLFNQGKIEWLNEHTVISVPKPKWYINYLNSNDL